MPAGRPPLPFDPDELRADVAAGLTTAQLATRHGCGRSTIVAAIARYGLQRRSVWERHPELSNVEWLTREIVNDRRSASSVARELGVSTTTVCTALSDAGIVIPRRGGPELDDVEWLRHEYVDNGRGMADIAEEIGVAPMTVSAALRRGGIPTRPRGSRWQPALPPDATPLALPS